MLNVSSLSVWESMKDGRGIQFILGNCHEKDKDWSKMLAEELVFRFNEVDDVARKEYLKLHKECCSKYEDYGGGKTKKEDKIRCEFRNYANQRFKYPFNMILQNMFDNEPYIDLMWESVKPPLAFPPDNE